MVKVLFVCLGNICRSPLAEGVMKCLVDRKELNLNFEIDSCGTSAYHIGELADRRMRDIAKSHGVLLTSRARQIEKNDLKKFDYIVAMDESNFKNIMLLKELGDTSHIVLMRDFDDNADDVNVPDPYYGGLEGFENVFQIVQRSCDKLLTEIIQKHDL